MSSTKGNTVFSQLNSIKSEVKEIENIKNAGYIEVIVERDGQTLEEILKLHNEKYSKIRHELNDFKVELEDLAKYNNIDLIKGNKLPKGKIIRFELEMWSASGFELTGGVEAIIGNLSAIYERGFASMNFSNGKRQFSNDYTFKTTNASGYSVGVNFAFLPTIAKGIFPAGVSDSYVSNSWTDNFIALCTSLSAKVPSLFPNTLYHSKYVSEGWDNNKNIGLWKGQSLGIGYSVGIGAVGNTISKHKNGKKVVDALTNSNVGKFLKNNEKGITIAALGSVQDNDSKALITQRALMEDKIHNLIKIPGSVAIKKIYYTKYGETYEKRLLPSYKPYYYSVKEEITAEFKNRRTIERNHAIYGIKSDLKNNIRELKNEINNLKNKERSKENIEKENILRMLLDKSIRAVNNDLNFNISYDPYDTYTQYTTPLYYLKEIYEKTNLFKEEEKALKKYASEMQVIQKGYKFEERDKAYTNYTRKNYVEALAQKKTNTDKIYEKKIKQNVTKEIRVGYFSKDYEIDTKKDHDIDSLVKTSNDLIFMKEKKKIFFTLKIKIDNNKKKLKKIEQDINIIRNKMIMGLIEGKGKPDYFELKKIIENMFNNEMVPESKLLSKYWKYKIAPLKDLFKSKKEEKKLLKRNIIIQNLLSTKKDFKYDEQDGLDLDVSLYNEYYSMDSEKLDDNLKEGISQNSKIQFLLDFFSEYNLFNNPDITDKYFKLVNKNSDDKNDINQSKDYFDEIFLLNNILKDHEKNILIHKLNEETELNNLKRNAQYY